MTSNEYALLSQNRKLFKPPILEVGGRHVSKLPNHRRLFSEDIEYLSLDLEEGVGVDIVHNMEEPLPKNQRFNSVICCSVLEHVQRPWLVAENINKCLNTGGHLYVAAPFVWRYHDYPGDYWRYTDKALQILFPNIEWVLMKYATKKRKEIADTYIELSNLYKAKQHNMSATVAVVIGLGVKI